MNSYKQQKFLLTRFCFYFPTAIHVPDRNAVEQRVEVKNEPVRIEKPIPTPIVPQQPIDVVSNQG